MAEGGAELEKIIQYMKAHWPSEVKAEWQVGIQEYPVILKKVLADFTPAATKNRQLIRIAGISGSGKTTQILPAAEAYAQVRDLKPILVAARRFVEYHPHYAEIRTFYGEENVRKLTDEFSTIMMFLILSAIIREGYDIMLDVTLLDPEMEGILAKMMLENNYQALLLMIAVSPVVTEKFLAGRKWRHTKETEQEFIRVTKKALEFYATAMPEMRAVIWNVYDLLPAYDGTVAQALPSFEKYSSDERMPKKDDDERREAKIKYLITES